MADNYFKKDDYWNEYINKKIEEDLWIKDYLDYFDGIGKCLDLGCGIGQYSKEFMSMGYDVISADISATALNKVKEFNRSIIKMDMSENFPFEDEEFDLVFSNLSIHYFSKEETDNIIEEVYRVLKPGGMFVGSVNGLGVYDKIKDTAKQLEEHFWIDGEKCVRLFNEEDLRYFLRIFKILKIEQRLTVRFNYKKDNYLFIAKKEK